MNNNRAKKAKIFRGRILYCDADGKDFDIPSGVYVEIGSPCDERAERGQKEFQSTYRAAQLAGYNIHWICTDDGRGNSKLLITGPREEGKLTSLPEVTAKEIVQLINKLVRLAKRAPEI